MMTAADYSTPDNPDLETIRSAALQAGGVDPMGLRFRIVQFEKATGELLGVPVSDVGFRDAVETAAQLIIRNLDSHFCLEPVGYIQ